MSIIEKALAGGIAAVIVYAIYWTIHCIFYKKDKIVDYPKTRNKEDGKSKRMAVDGSKGISNIPNPNDSISRFNYFYAFKWIPQIVASYKEGTGSIMSVIDVISINNEHPEFRQITTKIEYALTEYKSNQSIKALAITVPNTGAISEVKIAYVVFREDTRDAWYFTMETSVDREYAIAMPDSKGKHALYGFVKDANEFVERALEVVSEDINRKSAAAEHHQCVTEDNSSNPKSQPTSINQLYAYDSLSGAAEQSVMGEVASVINIAHSIILDRLGQMPIINETICYFIGASFLYPYLPNSFLLKSINAKYIPFFNDWVQRKILRGLEDLNNNRPKLSISLTDFAKAKGHMRIETGIRLDGEYGKYASFQKSIDELSRVEALFELPVDTITAKYIEQNKENLNVKQVDDVYYIYHRDTDEQLIQNYNRCIYQLLYGVSPERLAFDVSASSEFYESLDSKAVAKMNSIFSVMNEIEMRVIEQARLLKLIGHN